MDSSLGSPLPPAAGIRLGVTRVIKPFPSPAEALAAALGGFPWRDGAN